MTTIVTRAGKGSPLTWNEGDANFNNLNSAVIAAQATADTALAAATTTFTSVAVGVVPASGGGTTNFLRADGTFAAPAGTSIAVKDEGVTLTSAVSSIDFVGAGVSATNTGDAVTVTIAGGGGTPGGSNTQVQFNDGGAFGGDADFTWDKTNNVLTFGSTGVRIKADCSNATISNRFMFQTSTTNNNTFVGALPNGTGSFAGILAYGSNNPDYSTYSGVYTSTGMGYIEFGSTGGYPYCPVLVQVAGSVVQKYYTNGNVSIGTSIVDTGAKLYVEGAASNVALYIKQGATAGTALSLTDSTAASTLNFQPGTTTSYITYSHPLSFYSGGADRVTISTAGVLNASSDVQIGGVSVRTIPQNSQSAAYTLVAGDAGKHILHPSADTTARVFTIPANSSVAFPIGTAVTFVNQNGAGTITISITTDTMRLAGPGTTGSRTLAANGIATALKITSTEWIISGTGLT